MPVAKSRLEVMQVCRVMQLVRQQDEEQITTLIASAVPHILNYVDPTDGISPLSAAAIANDEKMLLFLLEKGAHADVADLEGRTAAMRAAEYGHVEAVRILAQVGKADMTLTDMKGHSILFYCISPTERHAKCMTIALNHKADVNAKAKDGRTALFAACETAKDNESVCLSILEKGAEVNVTQLGTNKTPLHMAAASGSVAVVRGLLKSNADPNAVDRHNSTPTHAAAAGGHFEVIVCLAAYGAHFDVYDEKMNNPIHLASLTSANCVKFLGQRGCNPRPKNEDGFQAKIIAKDNGQKECMKELRKLEKTFGKVGRNNEPWAIKLYDWVNDRQEEIMEKCEKAEREALEVDRDTEDSENEKEVKLSYLLPRDEIMDILESMEAPFEEDQMKKLAPVYDKLKDGRFDYREFMNGKKYVNKLYLMAAFEPKAKKGKKKGGKGGKQKKTKLPMEVCVMPEADMFRTFDGGPHVTFVPHQVVHIDNERFDRDKPPAHLLQDDSYWYMSQPSRTFINIIDAAKKNDYNTLSAAISQGYDVDTRDKYYKTALMVASNHGDLAMCKYLLENGANVNARDNFHWTPLHHACHSGMIDVVELLLANGAQIDAASMHGATPLYRAIEASRVNVVSYLISKNARVMLENAKGTNPMELSFQWGDAEVNARVQNKYDVMGPPKEGKDKGGKGKGKGKGSAKGGGGGANSSSTGVPVDPIFQPPGPRPSTPNDEQVHARRKASILRAASALAGGLEEREEVSYTPRKPWLPLPTTEELLKTRQERRDRFGWESDFTDFRMPFQKHVWQTALAEGGPDED